MASLIVGAVLALAGGSFQQRWTERRQLRHRLHFEVMTTLLGYQPHFLLNPPAGPVNDALNTLYRSSVLLGPNERRLINRLRKRLGDWPWANATDPGVGPDDLNQAGEDWNRDVENLVGKIARAIERRLTWRLRLRRG